MPQQGIKISKLPDGTAALTDELAANQLGTTNKITVQEIIDIARKVLVLRITTSTTIDATKDAIFADTDGGAITVTLPAGIVGTEYRIANTGTSSNNVTVTPNGSELLIGVNSSFTLLDGEALTIVFESTEGWN